jgi:hypothetical protein
VVRDASSWNKTALTTNSLCIADSLRSSIFNPSSVYQAVTASSVHHETGTATIPESSSPVEDITADGDYLTLGIFDAHTYSVTSRVDAEKAERLTHALASPCISVQTVSSFI